MELSVFHNQKEEASLQLQKYRLNKQAIKEGDGFHFELLHNKTAMVEGLCGSIIY
jgi:hypothetical protein